MVICKDLPLCTIEVINNGLKKLLDLVYFARLGPGEIHFPDSLVFSENTYRKLYRDNLRLLNQGRRIPELRVGVARSLEYQKMPKLGLQGHKD